MATIHKSALVKYSASQMFALVDDIEKYPEFLPWCSGTEVVFRDENMTRATIKINYHHLRQSFTTENMKYEPDGIKISLVHGPFRHLDGHWQFIALGEVGCKVQLDLHYEFSNKILERLFGPVFHYVANSFVDAFVKRAEKLWT
jgi:ribosome-associated toxin RatA of RatAB toxin-antitoxin module